MINFRGKLTGEARKYWIKKNRNFLQIIWLFAMVIMLPTAGMIKVGGRYFILELLLILSVVVLLASFFLPTRKEQEKQVPKRIYLQEDCIICISELAVETKFISDIKKIRDHGSFYEIVFPFGKISMQFICQKDLCSPGGINKFEEIFKRKITRVKAKKAKKT